MFAQKRNNINSLRRSFISILFLFVFMACGFLLTGLSQSEINEINNRPMKISSDEEFEEELPELLEVVEIVKLPKHYY